MSKRARNGSVPAFADFLAYLRAQGFSIGLDHYVRLQELLERIPPEEFEREWADEGDTRAHLSTLLCPLFATSQKQQERFYAAFANYADLLPVAPRLHEEASKEEGKDQELKPQQGPSRRWLYLGGTVLAVALALVAVKVGFVPALFPNPSPTPTPQATQPPTPDPLAFGGSNPPQVSPDPTQTPAPTVSPTTSPGDGSAKATSRPWKFYLLVSFALLLIFLLWELFHVLARKLILRRETARKPPTTWPIRVAASTPTLYDSEEFHKATRLMRRRQVAEYHRLDVNATIAATVAAGGFPSFRYKPDSKAPEYLVLIDRTSFRDHQAQLFNELVKAFEREGLFVVRYFYESDPRVCCDEKGEDCIHLSELQNRYAQHRLLIFGNGARMVDPITGNMASWASVFQEWQERAILTPEAEWGMLEFSLSTQFVVLPASLDGLLALVDHFEALITIDPRLWSKNALPAPEIDLEPGAAVAELQQHLGQETFQWLCACAVYPELQWNLTLYLGSLTCMSEGTVTERNLLKLIRLPWFHTGSMPDHLRWPLINQLGEREQGVRAAIIALLEKDPPSAGTFAAEKYDLELALQRWRYHQDAESLDELHRVIRRLPPGQILQDQTLVRYLERVPNPIIDLLLPRRLRKYFFKNGIPWFGLKTGVRLLVTLAAIILAAVLIRGGIIPVPSALQPTPTPSPSPSTPTPTPAVSPSASPLLSAVPVAKILSFEALRQAGPGGANDVQFQLCYEVRDAVHAGIDHGLGEVILEQRRCLPVRPTRTTIYTLSATGSDGLTVARQATVDASQPLTTPEFVGINVSPQTIRAGEQAQLCFQTKYASSVQIAPGVANLQVGRESQCLTIAPASTTTYTLTAFGQSGRTATRQVTVTIAAPPPKHARILDFNASERRIKAGTSVRLCYEIADAESASLSPPRREVPVGKNCVDDSPRRSITYVLTAVGEDRQPESRRVNVEVPGSDGTQVRITRFEIRPTTASGTQLCYAVENARSARIEPDFGELGNLTADCPRIRSLEPRTYTLIATGADGQTDRRSVDYRPPQLSRPVGNIPSQLPTPAAIKITSFTPATQTIKKGAATKICYRTFGEGTAHISPQPGRVPPSILRRCLTVFPQETTVYTLTVTDPQGQQDSRAITIRVDRWFRIP
jgi:hypothetical protein